ncbi:MAG: sulfur oxidation c-type cytochrome SoxA, partial [Burkholderiales bacterium]|nr:sulfur oxidation c-type cytochrome SoxA [Burkholderiales bacterium]
MKKRLCEMSAICALLMTFGAAAQSTDATTKEFETYRELMEADNPSEIYEDAGAEMWKAKRGPKQASLEQCDLGLGPGVVKG